MLSKNSKLTKYFAVLTIIGLVLSVTPESQGVAINCAQVLYNQNFSERLSENDYYRFSKIFAEGRIRDRNVPEFERWTDSLEDVLRPAERAAIFYYTYNPNFIGMNSPLRRGITEQQIEPYINAAIKLAVSGLSKLPNYVGDVYRGGVRNEKFLDEVLLRYQKGAIITEPTFLSTSKGTCWRCDFRHGPLVHFYIKSKTGKEVDNFSVNPREREVLFKPGTQFQVDKVDGRSIWMSEI